MPIPRKVGYPCECGCGETASVGSRFINYHYSRTKEWKEKMSIARKGVELSKRHKVNISIALLDNKNCFGHRHTEKSKRKMSKSQKGHVVSDATKLKMSKSAKTRLRSPHTEETKLKISEAHTGKVVSNITREKLRKAASGKKSTDEAKRKIGAASKGNQYALGYKHTEKAKREISKAGKKSWSDPIHHKKRVENQKRLWVNPVFHKQQKTKMAQGNTVKPNKPEIELLSILQTLYPDDWKYVGDGSLVISGKNPDFVNVNGKKLIIELFGDYWHRNDSPRKRMGVFKPFGYRTLIVWERELNNQKALTHKINRFINR